MAISKTEYCRVVSQNVIAFNNCKGIILFKSELNFSSHAACYCPMLTFALGKAGDIRTTSEGSSTMWLRAQADVAAARLLSGAAEDDRPSSISRTSGRTAPCATSVLRYCSPQSEMWPARPSSRAPVQLKGASFPPYVYLRRQNVLEDGQGAIACHTAAHPDLSHIFGTEANP